MQIFALFYIINWYKTESTWRWKLSVIGGNSSVNTLQPALGVLQEYIEVQSFWVYISLTNVINTHPFSVKELIQYPWFIDLKIVIFDIVIAKCAVKQLGFAQFGSNKDQHVQHYMSYLISHNLEKTS